MRYLDTGGRDPTQALGAWFKALLLDGDISEIRWQSGFYTSDGLGFLAPTIERMRTARGRVAVLVGSNNGDTLQVDIERLAELLGVPRENADLGVVSIAGAFFHPKVYHFRRHDGSQTAYVGSANLTHAGVGSLHIEAGIVLDTREGDSAETLDSIARSIDDWFREPGRVGLRVVGDRGTVSTLADEGILAAQPPTRALNEGGGANTGTAPPRPRLHVLVPVPAWGATPPPPPVPQTPEPIGDDDESESGSALSTPDIEWELVWRSRGLSERDLNIPSGSNTNATGSIGLKKGDWDEDIDLRHYFRDVVFTSLPWSRDTKKANREVTTALFEVWINGALAGETALTISHNTDTASATYRQHNEMTHLRWGEARNWVARRNLLGSVLTLYRERHPDRIPKFRIRIERH